MINLPAVDSLSPEIRTEQLEQLQKPKLKVIPNSDEPLNLVELLKIFLTQKRECWICKKVAENLQMGKEILEHDAWHFSTCVLSWENLSGLR